jgi:hypothetical protein
MRFSIRPRIAVLDAVDLEAELGDGRLGDDANDGVEPGAVAAAGQHADASDLLCHVSLLAEGPADTRVIVYRPAALFRTVGGGCRRTNKRATRRAVDTSLARVS